MTRTEQAREYLKGILPRRRIEDIPGIKFEWAMKFLHGHIQFPREPFIEAILSHRDAQTKRKGRAA